MLRVKRLASIGLFLRFVVDPLVETSHGVRWRSFPREECEEVLLGLLDAVETLVRDPAAFRASPAPAPAPALLAPPKKEPRPPEEEAAAAPPPRRRLGDPVPLGVLTAPEPGSGLLTGTKKFFRQLLGLLVGETAIVSTASLSSEVEFFLVHDVLLGNFNNAALKWAIGQSEVERASWLGRWSDRVDFEVAGPEARADFEKQLADYHATLARAADDGQAGVATIRLDDMLESLLYNTPGHGQARPPAAGVIERPLNAALLPVETEWAERHVAGFYEDLVFHAFCNNKGYGDARVGEGEPRTGTREQFLPDSALRALYPAAIAERRFTGPNVTRHLALQASSLLHVAAQPSAWWCAQTPLPLQGPKEVAIALDQMSAAFWGAGGAENKEGLPLFRPLVQELIDAACRTAFVGTEAELDLGEPAGDRRGLLAELDGLAREGFALPGHGAPGLLDAFLADHLGTEEGRGRVLPTLLRHLSGLTLAEVLPWPLEKSREEDAEMLATFLFSQLLAFFGLLLTTPAGHPSALTQSEADQQLATLSGTKFFDELVVLYRGTQFSRLVQGVQLVLEHGGYGPIDFPITQGTTNAYPFLADVVLDYELVGMLSRTVVLHKLAAGVADGAGFLRAVVTRVGHLQHGLVPVFIDYHSALGLPLADPKRFLRYAFARGISAEQLAADLRVAGERAAKRGQLHPTLTGRYGAVRVAEDQAATQAALRAVWTQLEPAQLSRLYNALLPSTVASE